MPQTWPKAQRRQLDGPASDHQQQQAFLQRLKQTQISSEGLGLEHGDATVARLAMPPSAEQSTVISSVISAMRSGLSVIRALLPAPLRKILDGEGSAISAMRLHNLISRSCMPLCQQLNWPVMLLQISSVTS